MHTMIRNMFTFDPATLKAQETPLACPLCEAHTFSNGVKTERVVVAAEPRELWRDGARKQDRMCRNCGHQWTSVLPPVAFANATQSSVSLFKL